MTEFVNRVFENYRITLDDNVYRDCVLKNCVMVYSGGKAPILVGNDFDPGTFEFRGAAAETLALLRGFIKEGGVLREIVMQELGISDGAEP